MPAIGSRESVKATRPGCLPLLMLPFAVIGTFIAFTTVRTLLTLLFMEGWTIVPATVQSVELAESGKTAQAVATYTYVFNGQTYTGHRVSLYGPDNLGSFHQDAYQTLHDSLGRKQPYPVHVNPRAPGESILMPVLRLTVLGFYLGFAFVFGGVGWGILTSSVRRAMKASKEAKLIEQYPNEPWKHRVEWSGPVIKATPQGNPVFAACLAIFWNVTTFPILLIVPLELSKGQLSALKFLAVPLIGIGLVVWASLTLARAKRFSGTYLQLETLPIRQGEPLRGRIYVPNGLEKVSMVSLAVRCDTIPASSIDTRRSTGDIQELWRQDSTTTVSRGQAPDGGVVMEVAFQMPPGLPDSCRGPGDECYWLLSANAHFEGPYFDVEFEFPVFAR